jgi:hypothetical protein
VPPLLPRFRPTEERAESERQVAKAIVEADEAPPDSNGRMLRRSADGHNHARRRGLPIISKASGARHREQIRYELCSARRLGASGVSSSR